MVPWLVLPLPAHSPTQVSKGAWASWNFLGESGVSTDASSDAAVTVSYWLNRLQVGRVLGPSPHARCSCLCYCTGHRYSHLASVLYIVLLCGVERPLDLRSSHQVTHDILHTATLNAVRVGCVLQHLPPEAPQMFVTLNPPHPPAADKVIRRLQLAHPVYRYVALASMIDAVTACN